MRSTNSCGGDCSGSLGVLHDMKLQQHVLLGNFAELLLQSSHSGKQSAVKRQAWARSKWHTWNAEGRFRLATYLFGPLSLGDSAGRTPCSEACDWQLCEKQRSLQEMPSTFTFCFFSQANTCTVFTAGEIPQKYFKNLPVSLARECLQLLIAFLHSRTCITCTSLPLSMGW